MININQSLGPQFVIQSSSEQLTLEVGIKSSSLFQNTGSGSSDIDGGKLQITTSIAVGAFRAVTYAGEYTDSDIPDLSNYAGVTTQAAIAGTQIQVVRVGNITELSWTWIPNQPIFISTNGILTQTPPALPLRRVGWAMSATQLNLDPFPIIGV